MAARDTPVMHQHAACKRAYPDAIVFFRLGDFYEMFGEDAVLCARQLDLTLTSRNKGKPDEIPMAGVPHHSAHGYVARLLELGHKVAICEQMADPAKVKGIVPREVVRVITPGLVTDGQQLDAATNNWLAAVDVDAGSVGLALIDLSTAELRAAELGDVSTLLAELGRAGPREVLVGFGPNSREEALQPILSSIRAVLPQAAVREDATCDESEQRDWLGSLEREVRALGRSARRATARSLRFVRQCTPRSELPIVHVGRWDTADTLVIDPTAQTHLELVSSVSGAKAATLLGVVDLTQTPPGARLLRRSLLAPLRHVERIRRRLDLVELFVVHARLRSEVRAALAGVGDLERLATRASLGEATPRDLGALRDGLLAARRAAELLEAVLEPASRETLGLTEEPLDTVAELADELARVLVERPPAQPKDGAIFQEGVDAELGELSSLRASGTERMVELEARLRRDTDIPTLKLRFTRVFGWYIEVTRSQQSRVPPDWRRKQTVATGERYTNHELDDLADRIGSAEERYRERELELLRQLTDRAAACSERVRTFAARVARWDVAAGLAELADRNDYCRPEVDDSELLTIVDGRHPVVERLAEAGQFVPNDVELEVSAKRLWLITGPNMAGKSTFLRQVALIVILAQMGSYVPARSARIGIADRVLSRVGASDNLARGESTFMVEMKETSEILRSATRRSLVILDEIGRGTSTFDGLAIAWAVAEYLDEVIGCRALFATHYHELVALADASAHAANYSVSAREHDGGIVFLHRVLPGATSRSYGVAVAQLAGLPESVLARARAVLSTLETGESSARGPGAKGSPSSARKDRNAQLDLFSPVKASNTERELLETLRNVDVNRLTPLEALELLAQLKQRL
jgi:DNA mismatch repair protein MutS